MRDSATRHVMTEFDWKKKMSRDDAASLLRRIADGLAGDGKVELEQEEWELTFPVGSEIALEVELEIEESEAELEIELKWSTARRAKPKAGDGG